jgi:hypothetical protein
LGVTAKGGVVQANGTIFWGERSYSTVGARKAELISRNGQRILFNLGSLARPRDLLDLAAVKCELRHGGYPQSLEPDLFKTAKPVTLRHRFHAIGVDMAGRLTLVGRRDGYWPFEYREREGILQFPSQPLPTQLRLRHNFELLDINRPDSYSLSAAVFDDGSRAVLDGRGLLHLKSSNTSLPELTIVIAEGATSGWRSDGTWWGNRYFIDQSLPRTPVHHEDVLRPFLERLR